MADYDKKTLKEQLFHRRFEKNANTKEILYAQDSFGDKLF